MKPLVALGVLLHQLEHQIGAASLPKFANRPKALVIQLPRRIQNPDRITVGDGVKLGPNSVLSANIVYPGGWLRNPEGHHVTQKFNPKIVIGNRVTATSSLQVVALKEIVIEDDVMFAANVFICDGVHSTRSGDKPYKYQGMIRITPIRIGRGCWIGQNVVILPGITIGPLAVIGANSVVTHDIPAQAVAFGNPARVIKYWDAIKGRWEDLGERPAGDEPSREDGASL